MTVLVDRNTLPYLPTDVARGRRSTEGMIWLHLAGGIRWMAIVRLDNKEGGRHKTA